MTTSTQTRKIPAPLYAAAGAGDLAYQRIRKLVAELRPAVTEVVSEPRLRADLTKLRKAARRNAAAFVNGAQVAQERATAVYTDLVERGERVVRSARTPVVKPVAKAPAEIRDNEAPQPSVADKAVKRARPAVRSTK
jgi:heparin binding hemagglutinin HbhA